MRRCVPLDTRPDPGLLSPPTAAAGASTLASANEPNSRFSAPPSSTAWPAGASALQLTVHPFTRGSASTSTSASRAASVHAPAASWRVSQKARRRYCVRLPPWLATPFSCVAMPPASAPALLEKGARARINLGRHASSFRTASASSPSSSAAAAYASTVLTRPASARAADCLRRVVPKRDEAPPMSHTRTRGSEGGSLRPMCRACCHVPSRMMRSRGGRRHDCAAPVVVVAGLPPPPPLPPTLVTMAVSPSSCCCCATAASPSSRARKLPMGSASSAG
mmetsp:Transcript_52011/g.173591  ORF Transcript_52011/g.173591 Transcript_52011/m.173591 type:complete len:278 (-) Transcript_52011:718-1551(-)